MQKPLPKVYANIVNVRTTPAELVLDFGCIIGDGEPVGDSVPEFEPDVRVIISVTATKKLGEMLLKAAKDHEEASNKAAATERAKG